MKTQTLSQKHVNAFFLYTLILSFTMFFSTITFADGTNENIRPKLKKLGKVILVLENASLIPRGGVITEADDYCTTGSKVTGALLGGDIKACHNHETFNIFPDSQNVFISRSFSVQWTDAEGASYSWHGKSVSNATPEAVIDFFVTGNLGDQDLYSGYGGMLETTSTTNAHLNNTFVIGEIIDETLVGNDLETGNLMVTFRLWLFDDDQMMDDDSSS